MVCSSSEVYIYQYYFALQILASYTNMTSVMAPSLPFFFLLTLSLPRSLHYYPTSHPLGL